MILYVACALDHRPRLGTRTRTRVRALAAAAAAVALSPTPHVPPHDTTCANSSAIAGHFDQRVADLVGHSVPVGAGEREKRGGRLGGEAGVDGGRAPVSDSALRGYESVAGGARESTACCC